MAYDKEGSRGRDGGKRNYGEKKPYGNQKPYGDKKPAGERSYGDRKPYGNRSAEGERPAYGEKKPYGDKKPYGERSYGDRKPYGNRSAEGERPAYGEKKPYGDKKPYGERSYGDRKPYGNRSAEGEHPAYGERSYGEKKPYGDRRPAGERKPYDRDRAYTREQPPAAPETERNQQQEEDELPFLIIGRNAVREAVKAGRSIDRILVQNEQDGSLREILTMARDRKLVIREVDRKKLDEVCLPFGHGGKTANHQGIAAYAAGVEYCEVSDILAAAKEKGEEPFVIVLDGIMDPHNLGSIIRSADCAGAHGVVIGKRRSASVTAAAVKAAAGATEHVKIARVTNLVTAIGQLKKAGLWVAGADMAGRPMTEQGLNGPLAVVIGNEGEGLGKLVSEACDFLVSIPMRGHIGSLNASVAAGVLLFEKRRQDAEKPEQA